MISSSVLCRMRNVSDKSCEENQYTRFRLKNFFFLQKSCRLLDNMAKYGRIRQATGNSIIQCSALHVGYVSLQTHTQIM